MTMLWYSEYRRFKDMLAYCPVRYKSPADTSALQRNQPGKEDESMASLTFVTPILPVKEEAWRRFYQELSGSRHTEYEL
jgi:hypothetical protein